MKKKNLYISFFFKNLFLIFVLLSIANLFFEILIISKNRLNQYANNSKKILLNTLSFPELVNQQFVDNHAIDLIKGGEIASYLPSIGQVYDFSNAATFQGTLQGRRVTPSEFLHNKKHQGIMLGASQSWGYFVPDNQIVSTILMNKLGDVAIDNYSIIGFTTQQNRLYWQSVKDDLSQPDFIVNITGVVDILQYCEIDPRNFYARKELVTALDVYFPIGLQRFYNKLKKLWPDETSGNSSNNFCSTKKQIENVVRRVTNELEFTLLMARKSNIRLAIIIPPVPFITGPNVSNFANDPEFERLKNILQPVYEALEQQINSNNYAAVVNLMHAFDGETNYFIDYTGHFSEKGHIKLAEKIIIHLGEYFFRP